MPDLEDYQADKVTVEVELTEPLYPDEEAGVVENWIETQSFVRSATVVGSNAEAGPFASNASFDAEQEGE